MDKIMAHDMLHAMLRYAAAIFLGAFLLFQVQPVMGKAILPWFGGTPAVWTTCMMFFQLLLLVGYAYAHLLAARLPLRTQGLLHLALLGVSLAALPILPSEAWKPAGEESPIPRILALLTISVGAPYFMLSTTGPLLQAWFLRENPGRSPYRLYALSNAGSLLGLLGYPFLVEPCLDLRMQGIAWAVLYAVFVACCGFSAWRIVSLSAASSSESAEGPAGAAEPEGAADSGAAPDLGSATDPERAKPAGRPAETAEVSPAPVRAEAAQGSIEDGTGSAAAGGRGAHGLPSPYRQTMWFGLAMFGSLMLLATTNQISLDVSVVPFMWVAPLCLYLVSFIICFDRERWYWRPVWLPLLVLSAAGACAMLQWGVHAPIVAQALVYPAAMFCCCMACHGELARLKPPGEYLTRFYLIVASGGAVGGVLAAVAAPNLLSGFWEYHISWGGAFLLVAIAVLADLRPADGRWTFRRWAFSAAAAFLLWTALTAALWLHYRDQREWVVAGARNFYGVLRVKRTSSGGKDGLTLVHGRIAHGFQFDEGEYRNKPISYFCPESGFGKAMLFLRTRAGREGERKGLHIGVLGLGAGCMAAWGEEGDRMRFYEINPDVVALSDEYFSYRKESKARQELVMGDGRISLERELVRGEVQGFDILALDAFSGDAVPLHLLTREAFEIYWKHLKPGGILAVNISNRFVALEPLVYGLAEKIGKRAALIENWADEEKGYDAASWILVTNSEEFLSLPDVEDRVADFDDKCRRLVFTDDYSNLFSLLKWR